MDGHAGRSRLAKLWVTERQLGHGARVAETSGQLRGSGRHATCHISRLTTSTGPQRAVPGGLVRATGYLTARLTLRPQPPVYESESTTPEPQATTLAHFWNKNWWPTHPLATDWFFEGVYDMPRDKALQRRYLQTNATQRYQNIIPVDIDHGDAFLRAVNPVCPANIVTENKKTGRAHALWVLAAPVTISDQHPKPGYFLRAVREGLRRACDGDPAYAGLTTKNPLHPEWGSTLVRAEPYQLHELAEWLRAEGFYPEDGWWKTARGRLSQAQLERSSENPALFEAVRHPAYAEAKRFTGTLGEFTDLIRGLCYEAAGKYPSQPPWAIEATARSIANYSYGRSFVARHGAHTPAFLAKQKASSMKAAAVRTQRAIPRQDAARALREKGMSYGEIGKRLGITRDAASGRVRRALKRVSPCPVPSRFPYRVPGPRVPWSPRLPVLTLTGWRHTPPASPAPRPRARLRRPDLPPRRHLRVTGPRSKEPP